MYVITSQTSSIYRSNREEIVASNYWKRPLVLQNSAIKYGLLGADNVA